MCQACLHSPTVNLHFPCALLQLGDRGRLQAPHWNEDHASTPRSYRGLFHRQEVLFLRETGPPVNASCCFSSVCARTPFITSGGTWMRTPLEMAGTGSNLKTRFSCFAENFQISHLMPIMRLWGGGEQGLWLFLFHIWAKESNMVHSSHGFTLACGHLRKDRVLPAPKPTVFQALAPLLWTACVLTALFTRQVGNARGLRVLGRGYVPSTCLSLVPNTERSKQNNMEMFSIVYLFWKILP